MKAIKTIYKALFLVTAILTSCGVSSGDKQEKTNSETKTETIYKIRYDGLYRTEPVDGSRKYLRFYSDNVVVSVSVIDEGEGDANKIIKWLDRSWDELGIYKVDGSSIFCSIKSFNYGGGESYYDGHIESENKLKLKYTNLRTLYSEDRVYYFVEI
ncbi:MAG: hypothetical protein A2W93_11895 [Bacteroidetes bacterium GWF2_43_63]|nr:MAG: hypothetical protein A2W94_00430 [Bacteroidetes bacterium GWE2_42_42]OFY55446.1 MAG: hypothetical protein A2W93_11895 [Bacteroidetes bacterium GWF2_43_63]HBG70301.1 hypothetical protein [Bacteroidales bacterium]HCB60314.1 hypothetical protein [Bacteroidales bacterium]HCY23574.1 hypothetical protein [Bacteroidales bacterium]